MSKYIKLNKKDKFIRDFIDYIGFYWSRVKTDWFYLFASDNGSSAYVDRIEISRGASRSWNLLLEGFLFILWLYGKAFPHYGIRSSK